MTYVKIVVALVLAVLLAVVTAAAQFLAADPGVRGGAAGAGDLALDEVFGHGPSRVMYRAPRRPARGSYTGPTSYSGEDVDDPVRGCVVWRHGVAGRP